MALEYGMTSDEFWRDDPDLFWSYRTFFINKEKRKIEYDNYMCWLTGLYNYKGFRTTYSNAWSKNSTEKYPDKPLNILKEQNTEVKISKEKQREIMSKQYEQDLIFFSSIKQRFIDSIKEKGE